MRSGISTAVSPSGRLSVARASESSTTNPWMIHEPLSVRYTVGEFVGSESGVLPTNSKRGAAPSAELLKNIATLPAVRKYAPTAMGLTPRRNKLAAIAADCEEPLPAGTQAADAAESRWKLCDKDYSRAAAILVTVRQSDASRRHEPTRCKLCGAMPQSRSGLHGC